MKKGYSQKFHHCIKACFKIFILSDIFCYEQYFNYSIFLVQKHSFKEKNYFSGSIFCDQLFCELHFKLIFSETNSNRKKNIFGLQISKLDFNKKKTENFNYNKVYT